MSLTSVCRSVNTEAYCEEPTTWILHEVHNATAVLPSYFSKQVQQLTGKTLVQGCRLRSSSNPALNQDMLHYSKNQVGKHATNAIMPKSLSFAQVLAILRLRCTYHRSTERNLPFRKEMGCQIHGAEMTKRTPSLVPLHRVRLGALSGFWFGF